VRGAIFGLHFAGAAELNLMLYVNSPRIMQKEWYIPEIEKDREKAGERTRARI